MLVNFGTDPALVRNGIVKETYVWLCVAFKM